LKSESRQRHSFRRSIALQVHPWTATSVACLCELPDRSLATYKTTLIVWYLQKVYRWQRNKLTKANTAIDVRLWISHRLWFSHAWPHCGRRKGST